MTPGPGREGAGVRSLVAGILSLTCSVVEAADLSRHLLEPDQQLLGLLGVVLQTRARISAPLLADYLSTVGRRAGGGGGGGGSRSGGGAQGVDCGVRR